MKSILSPAIVLMLVLAYSYVARAFETDQYNLPPTPLADIGEEVSEYAEENIREAIAKLNAKIAALQICLENNTGANCGSPENTRKRLLYLRSNDAIAREIFNRLGYGLIAFTKAGSWMNSHKFSAQPARYKTTYGQSIFVYLPTDYFTISPTVKMYGHSLGTDKIAHFFQQGYTYYRIHRRASAKGLPDEKATRKAVDWGKLTERTYYGTLVGGVFSNADLYANYAGMRFYQGLTQSLTIGQGTRPETLLLEDGLWSFNEKAKPALIMPFITDHLNEALNPSLYIPGLRSSIRGIVKKRSCNGWRSAYPDKTRKEYEFLTASLTSWNGEDYGHKHSDKFVTIANTCF